MRYVIVGAGAIGGGIGGLLARAGTDTTLVARGAHLAAIRERGLELRTPSSNDRVEVAAVPDVASARLARGDVVVLAVKGQDAAGALAELAAGERGVTVACAMNGVDAERQALRYFASVVGVHVAMPSTYLEPGVIELVEGVPGVLDLGRYPSGVDAEVEAVAADLRTAGFSSEPDGRIQDRKYRKLLANLTNVLDAASGNRAGPLADQARAEAAACLAAAGIAVTSEADDAARRVALTGSRRPIPGGGQSSSWQSLARSTGSIETDWLNGEIVLLGRLHGVPTPVNEALAELGRRMAAEGLAPGSVDLGEVVAGLGR